MSDAPTREFMAQVIRHLLSPEDRGHHPFYAGLVDALANSEVAIDLMLSVRAGQQNPTLLLAALHREALLGLAPYGDLYEGLAHPIADATERAAAVVAALEADPARIAAQMHRSTQTNEVGRSAMIRAVLHELYERGVTDIALIDVGTSAGLNLYPDHYDVAASGTKVDSALTLHCDVLEGDVAFAPWPTIHERIGIDPNPLDPANAEDALWLRACLWPEQAARTRRLDAVLAAIGNWPSATRLKGTALERLDEALALRPDDRTTLVMHSWAAAYFSPHEQVQWRDRMVALTATQPLYWLSLENSFFAPGLELPAAKTPAPRAGATQIVVTEPGGTPEAWGWCHPHGHWLSFCESASGPKA